MRKFPGGLLMHLLAQLLDHLVLVLLVKHGELVSHAHLLQEQVVVVDRVRTHVGLVSLRVESHRGFLSANGQRRPDRLVQKSLDRIWTLAGFLHVWS